jgi:hypothetical protein
MPRRQRQDVLVGVEGVHGSWIAGSGVWIVGQGKSRAPRLKMVQCSKNRLLCLVTTLYFLPWCSAAK